MKYSSTRGLAPEVTFSEAVANGLAPDGGLYLPTRLPPLPSNYQSWADLSYPEVCFKFFSLFATDLDPSVLRSSIELAYADFDHPKTAPLRTLEPGLHVLELFHGPTLAFKDFALQLLGQLYHQQIIRTGKPITVLGATSGDTGAAAIHGLLHVDQVRLFILYPDGRVAPLQERQMTCTGADNVFPLAIVGSFDDAQTALKEAFGDLSFQSEVGLSAVNSINLARILAQSVYYLYAWLQLPSDARSNVQFVVPTGNFGNVLAGWLVRQMGGLGHATFQIATNQNDILYRLFTTGLYSLDQVAPSLAPSMDIQIASNFERFIHYLFSGDGARVRQTMEAFKNSGQVDFGNFDRMGLSASRTSDAQIPQLIKDVYQKYNYVVDPHTACGFNQIQLTPGQQTIVLSTAHPAKFPDTIESAIGLHPTAPRLEMLKARPIKKYPLQPTAIAIKEFIRSH
ncbi:MAG: threonine synthase [Puniceicoccaceae bacterium]